MFARMSGFVGAVLVLCALLIVLGARGMFLWYERGHEKQVADTADQHAHRSTSPYGNPAVAALGYDSVALGRVQQRLDELQSRSLQLQMSLDEHMRRLQEKEAECRDLAARLDDSQGMILALLAEHPLPVDDAPATELPAASESTETALAAELQTAQRLRMEAEQQVEMLRQEVARVEQERNSLQEMAAQEITALLEEKLVLENVAGNVMAQLGEASAPLLIELLRHEHPEVRLWAASTLGKIGPAAQLAIEPLSALRRDADQRVAAEARRALARIDP